MYTSVSISIYYYMHSDKGSNGCLSISRLSFISISPGNAVNYSKMFNLYVLKNTVSLFFNFCLCMREVIR